MTIPHAAGALYSTCEDLLKWDQALYTEKLLPAKALERAVTPFKDGYAYGWSVRTVEGAKVIGHGGGINGFSTMITRVPEQKLLAVALANVIPSQSGKVAEDLASLAAGREVAVPKARAEVRLGADVLERYTGEWLLESGPKTPLTVAREDDQLYVQLAGQPKFPVFAESATKFFLKAVEAEIEFTADGKCATLRQGGRDMKVTRK